jgi:hypothetical protein
MPIIDKKTFKGGWLILEPKPDMSPLSTTWGGAIVGRLQLGRPTVSVYAPIALRALPVPGDPPFGLLLACKARHGGRAGIWDRDLNAVGLVS